MAKRIFTTILVLILPLSLFGQYNEVEPNNTTSQANVLALGDSSIISAQFSSTVDIDYFSVEMNDSSMYYITSIENADGVRPNIELYVQGNSNNILTSNVAGRNANDNFRLSGYVPATSGIFYAKIFNTKNTTGAYKVRLAGGRSQTRLLVHEPDNTLAHAAFSNKLAEDDTVYGAIYPANDVDYFRISGEEGKYYTIGTTPILDLHPRDTDTYITLFDSDGNIVDENDDLGNVDTPSGSLNCTFSQMTGVFPSSGNYYVAVRSYYNSDFGATISETNPPTGEYGIYYLAEDEEPREYVDRYPHVVLPTLNSISIQWNTLQKTATTLYWGEDETCSNTISDEELVNEHLVKITGLQPGSKYFYRVVFNDITTEPEHFYTTKPATTENVKFFIIGDSGSNVAGVASSENQLAVTDKIMKKEYDFGLHAGDVNQTIGDEYDFIFYTGYKDILKNTPIFTCIGNHDTYHDNARTYLNSFYLPHNNPDSTERYYSFNYGPAHFIALDTDSPYSPGTPQYEWLVQDLQSEMRAETKWTIVYFHKPPWSEGWPEYPGEIGVRTNLVPLFEQYDIDLVFNGHTHDYERGILNDVCYVITGGGGCSLEPGGQYYDYDHVTVRVCEYHFTYISISGNTLQLEAINKDGVEIDNLVINKETNSVERDDNAVPEEMALFNNYPNPFNPATTITFRAAKDDHYSLRVYNLSGQQVAVLLDEHRQTGTYKVSFDASHLTSGTYFYRLQGGGMDMVKKMILLK